jgi:phosphoglycolate phosphatase-like HAD superfamily hydrolase
MSTTNIAALQAAYLKADEARKEHSCGPCQEDRPCLEYERLVDAAGDALAALDDAEAEIAVATQAST